MSEFNALKSLLAPNEVFEDSKKDPEDKNKDGVVSPDESSNVRTASDDMKAAKLHADSLEKLADTIKRDIGKYTAKIEAYINKEFGGLSVLSEINPVRAKSIINVFSKLHDIANAK
jgi:hypothetical protein